jgi:hypothetical protein
LFENNATTTSPLLDNCLHNRMLLCCAVAASLYNGVDDGHPRQLPGSIYKGESRIRKTVFDFDSESSWRHRMVPRDRRLLRLKTYDPFCCSTSTRRPFGNTHQLHTERTVRKSGSQYSWMSELYVVRKVCVSLFASFEVMFVLSMVPAV